MTPLRMTGRVNLDCWWIERSSYAIHVLRRLPETVMVLWRDANSWVMACSRLHVKAATNVLPSGVSSLITLPRCTLTRLVSTITRQQRRTVPHSVDGICDDESLTSTGRRQEFLSRDPNVQGVWVAVPGTGSSHRQVTGYARYDKRHSSTL